MNQASFGNCVRLQCFIELESALLEEASQARIIKKIYFCHSKGQTKVAQMSLKSGILDSGVTAEGTMTWEAQPGLFITMRTIGKLPGGAWSQAFGVNELGVVVGGGETSAPERVQAFLWTEEGGIQPIVADGWSITRARDVNRSGVVAGTGLFGGRFMGFRWTGSEIVPLFPPADGPVSVYAVDGSGAVVGGALQGSLNRAVVWDAGGSGAKFIGGGIVATDINDNGYITGTVAGDLLAVFWQFYPCCLMTGDKIDPLPGNIISQAEGLNNGTLSNNLQIVGWSSEGPAPTRAFIWDYAGGIRELPALGGNYTKAFDVNDDGMAVGQSQIESGKFTATLWLGGMPIDLDPETTGSTSSSAEAINENGMIVGSIRVEGNSLATVWTIEGDATPTIPELFEHLASTIDDLLGTGTLNAGEGNALHSKLDNASRLLQMGKIQPAVNLLMAFTSQIEALVRSGRLTDAQAQPLFDGAQEIIESLEMRPASAKPIRVM